MREQAGSKTKPPAWTLLSYWVEFAGMFGPKRNHKLVAISRW